ncbi:MAG: DUF4437 domain-containing protein [Aestuariibacter sp.]
MSLKLKTIGCVLLLLGNSNVWAKETAIKPQILLAENVKWGYLNPLRGEKSPGAANLWGDRTSGEATGMLVRFKKGFSSPAHIHNISYRGIVIEGLMHNDHPNAQSHWLPTGSFWTQPAGQNHITAANGESNLIYLEIDEGPYLVQPSTEQFDNGEHPVNVHASNIVWLNEQESALVSSDKANIAYLWRKIADYEVQGVLLKLAAGFNGRLSGTGEELHGIVVSGGVNYETSGRVSDYQLSPGSYFSSTEYAVHKMSVKDESIIYLRFSGRINVTTR